MAGAEKESFTSVSQTMSKDYADSLQFIYEIPEYTDVTNLQCLTPIYVMKDRLQSSYSFRGTIDRHNLDSLKIDLTAFSNIPEDVLVSWSAYLYNSGNDTYLSLGERRGLSKDIKQDENSGLCVSMTDIHNFLQKQPIAIQWNVKLLLSKSPLTDTTSLLGTQYDSLDKLICNISKIANILCVQDCDGKRVETVHASLDQCQKQQSSNEEKVKQLETRLSTATGQVNRLCNTVKLQERQVNEIVADFMNVLSLARDEIERTTNSESDCEDVASYTDIDADTNATRCSLISSEHLLSLENDGLENTILWDSRNVKDFRGTIQKIIFEKDSDLSEFSENEETLRAIGINTTADADDTVSKEHISKTVTGNATVKEYDMLSFLKDAECGSISSMGYYSDDETSPHYHHRKSTIEHHPFRRNNVLRSRSLKNRPYLSQTSLDDVSPTLRHLYLTDSLGKTALNITYDSGDMETCHFLSLLSNHWELKQKRKDKLEELNMSLDEESTLIGQHYKGATHKGFKKKYSNHETMTLLSGHSCVEQVDISNVPLDLTNKAGESALSIAAELGDIKVLKTLIRVGAKVTETALLKAVINQHKACIVKLLINNAPFSDSLLREILNISSETVFKVFLEAEKNVTYQAERSETMTVHTLDEPILHKAVRCESIEAVRCLIRAGVNVHKRNLQNETALNIAVKSINIDVIIELLKAKAILSQEETEAVLRQSKGTEHFEIVLDLIRSTNEAYTCKEDFR